MDVDLLEQGPKGNEGNELIETMSAFLSSNYLLLHFPATLLSFLFLLLPSTFVLHTSCTLEKHIGTQRISLFLLKNEYCLNLLSGHIAVPLLVGLTGDLNAKL